MRVELGLSQRSLRRWQIEIARRLRDIPGVAVGVRWTKQAGENLPSCIGLLLGLERGVYGVHADLSAPAEPTELSAYVGTGGVNPDLVIDLAGGEPGAGRRAWRLTFDGGAGDAPLLAALLEGRAPIIALSDAHSGTVIVNARPGIRENGSVLAGFEAVLARTADLIAVAVRAGGTPLRLRPTPSRLSCNDAVIRGVKSLAGAARIGRPSTTRMPIHARIGWRFVAGPDVIDLGTHPASGWSVLPDDGKRSYAHPFPIVTRGQTWLFMTEKSFRTGKNLISALKFGHHGPLGTPAPVLELPADVSYPFVFEAEGNIWMIPQRAGSNSIDLYRATRFPGGWRHEARLVSGIETSVPTLFRSGGRWWLIATVRDGSAIADMLHLWSADDIRGPWRPHAANPVLIDAATALSAGRVVERGGRLIRPVQNRGNSTRGLMLTEIVRLDDEAFEQRILGEIENGVAWPSRIVTTLNRAGAIECLDGADFAVSPAAAASPIAPDAKAPFMSASEIAGAV